MGLCLGPYGSPMGAAVSYERGTPVLTVKKNKLMCSTTHISMNYFPPQDAWSTGVLETVGGTFLE